MHSAQRGRFLVAPSTRHKLHIFYEKDTTVKYGSGALITYTCTVEILDRDLLIQFMTG